MNRLRPKPAEIKEDRPLSESAPETHTRVAPAAPVEWRVSDGLTPYPEAVAAMEARAAAIARGETSELVWLVEHPPLYTAGTSAKAEDLLEPGRFPVFETGRGGQFTYHGPGQRVAYTMLSIAARGGDIRRFVRDLEEWIIRTLARFNIKGERREGRVGIWIARPGGIEDKIAALGIRVRRGVTYHGIAINLDPDLGHFSGIVPCGIQGGVTSPYGVTSMVREGILASMPELDMALRGAFEEVFGGTTLSRHSRESGNPS
ncbi:octanoyltransferase [Hypericibacter adhaerens]|uniref:Octanoyltransferase n=1 Tax=Hypericibacter adhaerens TaxID=2602016 RepID=A0A5J6MX94_9PROT|nr:octanoyltransferase [Hypericibacter adhaerens]